MRENLDLNWSLTVRKILICLIFLFEIDAFSKAIKNFSTFCYDSKNKKDVFAEDISRANLHLKGNVTLKNCSISEERFCFFLLDYELIMRKKYFL